MLELRDIEQRGATAEEVALLRGALEIDSPSGGERPLAEYLCAEMARRGLRAHIDAAGNAVGEIGEEGPLVVLLGHMDTAPGRVLVRREGDLLYGRGAVDAKGPLTAFICAAARIGARAGLRLAVIGAVEEESATSRGARHVAARYRPDACVIGEPSNWDRVTLGYKGRLLVEYHTAKDAAHTAAPEATAAERAVRFWNHVVAISDAHNDGAAREFERLRPTLRQIQGGSDGLHDMAGLTLSFRLPPNCDVGELQDRLYDVADGGEVDVTAFEPAYLASKNTALVRAFLGAIRAGRGTPAFALKTGTSDMNVVGPVWECPILAYGPGDSSLDHTPNEHIDIGEYGQAISVLENALAGLGSQGPL